MSRLGDDEKTPTVEVNVDAYRRRKTWIKVPPGHTIWDPPSDGGVEHFQVPVT